MSIRKGTTIIAGNSSPLDWTGTLQEYNIALENGTIKENMVCYITDDTLYTDDIRPEIETLNSVKANKDLSNLSEVGEKHFLNKSQITNCITEIPQRIKLELKDGVLTLKAGSEVIVPNGFEEDGTTPKFDYITITSDISSTNTNTGGASFVYYSESYGNPALVFSHIGSTISGASIQANYTIYNTSINKVNYLNSNSEVQDERSLPIAIVQRTGVISSIDQVFNGIGYIGSTVWVDKDVKCLMPNGRNEDGTLNNLEFTVPHITMRTYPTNQNTPFEQMFGIDNKYGLGESTLVELDYIPTTLLGDYFNWVLHTPSNIIYQWDGTAYTPKLEQLCVIGDKVTINNGIIKSLQSKQPFRAVDYSDKSEISSWGMPSGRYIDLTLGATGTEYTAPANGWVVWHRMASVGQDIHLSNLTSTGDTKCLSMYPYASIAGKLEAYIPVKKGDRFRTGYSANASDSNNVNCFRFIYAQGEL